MMHACQNKRGRGSTSPFEVQLNFNDLPCQSHDHWGRKGREEIGEHAYLNFPVIKNEA